jgi:hypothetical protein
MPRIWLEPVPVPGFCSVSFVMMCDPTAEMIGDIQGQSEQDPQAHHGQSMLYSRATFKDVDSMMATVDELRSGKRHKETTDRLMRNAPGRKTGFKNKNSFLGSSVDMRIRLREITTGSTASTGTPHPQDILDDMQLSPKRKKRISKLLFI